MLDHAGLTVHVVVNNQELEEYLYDQVLFISFITFSLTKADSQNTGFAAADNLTQAELRRWNSDLTGEDCLQSVHHFDLSSYTVQHECIRRLILLECDDGKSYTNPTHSSRLRCSPHTIHIRKQINAHASQCTNHPIRHGVQRPIQLPEERQ